MKVPNLRHGTTEAVLSEITKSACFLFLFGITSRDEFVFFFVLPKIPPTASLYTYLHEVEMFPFFAFPNPSLNLVSYLPVAPNYFSN